MKTFGKIFLITLLLSGFSLEALAFSINLNPEGEIYAKDFLKNEEPVIVDVPSNIASIIRNSNSQPSPSFFKNTSTSFGDYINTNKTGGGTENFNSLATFVKNSVIPKFKTRNPQDAKWSETDGRVTEFQPDVPGLAVDPIAIVEAITKSVRGGEAVVTLNPTIIPAQIKLADINNRGIASLVARGSSDFSGSTSTRIKNIRVGVSRFHGLIIPAGQTFSFNGPLGPVDGEHGYAPELVIKHNGVFPEFGGGLCQVSSTMFRAALNGGLPVTERRNHSFAVHYYSPQGTDATIYPGVQDLKFINDTPGDILIWSRIEGVNLYFDFYGQPDNRVVEVQQPVKYDIKTTGAFKTSLTRVIKYSNGNEKKDLFTSNYRPEAEFTRTTTAAEPAAPPITEPAPETPPQA